MTPEELLQQEAKAIIKECTVMSGNFSAKYPLIDDKKLMAKIVELVSKHLPTTNAGDIGQELEFEKLEQETINLYEEYQRKFGTVNNTEWVPKTFLTYLLNNIASKLHSDSRPDNSTILAFDEQALQKDELWKKAEKFLHDCTDVAWQSEAEAHEVIDAMVDFAIAHTANKNREIADFKRWKAEAIAVMPDYQKIGELLGLKLGQSVHDKIVPGIEKLQADKKQVAEAAMEEMYRLFRENIKFTLDDLIPIKTGMDAYLNSLTNKKEDNGK